MSGSRPPQRVRATFGARGWVGFGMAGTTRLSPYVRTVCNAPRHMTHKRDHARSGRPSSARGVRDGPEAPFPSFAVALKALLATSQPPEDWFSPGFLSQVSLEQVSALVSELAARGGRTLEVRVHDTTAQIALERGRVTARGGIDGEGRIGSLFVGSLRQAESTPALVEAFERLPGAKGLLICRGEEELASVAPDEPLAIGSCFKLAVLRALLDKVAEGVLELRQVVEMQGPWRTLPSGVAQDWPEGSAITLETLALLMVSISDNTATDALISVVGRESVESSAPLRPPVLTTREAFVLRSGANRDLLDRFRGADLDARRAVLAACAARELPALEDILAQGEAVEIVDWFASPRELTAMLASVAAHRTLAATRGWLLDGHWKTAVYKGGSDPRVQAVALRLTPHDGPQVAISAIWNGAELPEDESVPGLVQSLADSLARP